MEPDQDRRSPIDHPLLRRALGLAPAAVFVLALFEVLPNPARAVLLTGGFFLVPGALVWWALGGPLTRDVAALPAVAFAGSMVVLVPATIGFLFLQLSAVQVAWFASVVLVILGWVASSSPLPRLERPRRMWWVVAVIGVAVASLYRAGDFDWLTHISMANVIRESGTYPDVNPFLIGELPLAPRWRLNGWTGWFGILSHLSGVGARPLTTVLLPPLFVMLAASALFLFASYLGGKRFAAIATVLGAAVLPVVVVDPESVMQTRLWLSSASQDKSVGFLVLLPVLMVVLLRLFHQPAPSRAIAAAGLFVALFFVHPLMFVFGVLLIGTYVLVEAIMTRALPWRPALWVAAAIFPAGILGLGLNLSSAPYGFSVQGVDVTHIAAPREVGPITVWEPFKVMGLDHPDAPDAETFYARRRLGYLGGAPARYMIIGGTVMPSFRLLLMPVHAAILLAALVACIRVPRGRLKSWFIASTALALVPFLVPPAAAVLGKVATPWVLWRFIWLLPLPLIGGWLLDRAVRRFPVDAVVAVGLAAVLATAYTSRPWGGVAPFRALPVAKRLADKSGVLMAPRSAARWAVIHGGNLKTVFGPTIQGANSFPRDRLEEARRRDFAVLNFYFNRVTPQEKEGFLETYGVTHVLVKQGYGRRLEGDGLPLVDPEFLPQNFVLYRVAGSDEA